MHVFVTERLPWLNSHHPKLFSSPVEFCCLGGGDEKLRSIREKQSKKRSLIGTRLEVQELAQILSIHSERNYVELATLALTNNISTTLLNQLS